MRGGSAMSASGFARRTRVKDIARERTGAGRGTPFRSPGSDTSSGMPLGGGGTGADAVRRSPSVFTCRLREKDGRLGRRPPTPDGLSLEGAPAFGFAERSRPPREGPTGAGICDGWFSEAGAGSDFRVNERARPARRPNELARVIFGRSVGGGGGAGSCQPASRPGYGLSGLGNCIGRCLPFVASSIAAPAPPHIGNAPVPSAPSCEVGRSNWPGTIWGAELRRDLECSSAPPIGDAAEPGELSPVLCRSNPADERLFGRSGFFFGGGVQYRLMVASQRVISACLGGRTRM